MMYPHKPDLTSKDQDRPDVHIAMKTELDKFYSYGVAISVDLPTKLFLLEKSNKVFCVFVLHVWF